MEGTRSSFKRARRRRKSGFELSGMTGKRCRHRHCGARNVGRLGGGGVIITITYYILHICMNGMLQGRLLMVAWILPDDY